MTAARQVARPVAPFVGREHDHAAELLRLLDLDGSAPVSVVGPGGVGKTRLSLEALADISDRGANRAPDRTGSGGRCRSAGHCGRRRWRCREPWPPRSAW